MAITFKSKNRKLVNVVTKIAMMVKIHRAYITTVMNLCTPPPFYVFGNAINYRETAELSTRVIAAQKKKAITPRAKRGATLII